jgi:hypothetical protein
MCKILSKNQIRGTGRCLFSTALILILSSGVNCLAMGLLGPPTAGLEQGQFDLGGEYAYSNVDFEAKDGSWTEYLDNSYNSKGNADSFTIKNFKTSTGFVRFGYGIGDNAEVFVRLGTSKARFDDSIWEDSEKFNSDFDSVFGVGFKVTVFEQENFKFGGLFQADTAQYDGQLYANHWASRDFVKADITQFKIAIGGTCILSEGFSVFGGPFLHFINGSLTDELTEVDSGTGGLLRSKYTWEIREDSIVGGYIGARIDIAENSSVALEFQHTSGADVIGAGVDWRF